MAEWKHSDSAAKEVTPVIAFHVLTTIIKK